jgi:alkylated DNA repair dioxygenase AlkB
MDLLHFHNLVNNEKIKLQFAELDYFPGYFRSEKELFSLFETLEFKQNKIQMYGKLIDIPRLEIWFGDKDYTYTGNTVKAHPIPEELKKLMNEITRLTGYEFNSVLVNKYRDGSDYASWHADDEKELGASPAIASVSFGDKRRFALKSIHTTDERHNIDLYDGDLLIMHRGTQENYKHSLLKTSKLCNVRYNLTFRYIY